MKISYLLLLTIVSFLCAMCNYPGSVNDNSNFTEIKTICKTEVDSLSGYKVNFRNESGQIDWDWYITTDLTPIPDSVVVNDFGDVAELNKWKGYQECFCEYFYEWKDSVVFLVISNRVFNNNEANKYLVVLDHNMLVKKVMLLARIAKSPDDIFEVQSYFLDSRLKQFQLHSFIENGHIITDSVSYSFETVDYINYLLDNKDSIRKLR